MGFVERHRTAIMLLLVGLILAGGAFLLYRQSVLPRGTELVIEPPSPDIYVFVDGEVASPGVYALSLGARLVDAVEAAGGFSPDADQGSVNLAAPLRDGQQVRVYGIGEVPQRINVNTADTWLLQLLPGIGEVLAGRIVSYRNANGGFDAIDELTKVDGIGDATVDQLRDWITVR